MLCIWAPLRQKTRLIVFEKGGKGDLSVKAIADRQMRAFAPGSVCVEVASTSLGVE